MPTRIASRLAPSPQPSLSQRLASLPNLSKPGLCELWQQLFKREPPPEIRKDLMLRILPTACKSNNSAASTKLVVAAFAKSQVHSRPTRMQAFRPGRSSSRELV